MLLSVLYAMLEASVKLEPMLHRFLQGYGDFHAYSVPEAIFVIIYVFINIGVAAYIIGELHS